MEKESAAAIDETASAWMARFDRGLSSAEDAQLSAWLSSDPRHLGAFARMRALAAQLEISASDYRLTEAGPSAEAANGGLSRRRWIQSAAALATAGVVAGLLWRRVGEQRVVTRLGERRVFAAADGSLITLNTASAVSIRMEQARRTVKLLYGEALFHVARDPLRPFQVTAGNLELRVVGTTFDVRQVSQLPTQVLVQEGIVEASAAAAPDASALRLTANMRGLMVGTSPVTASEISPLEIQRQLMWRDGRLLFQGESLAEAAAEFARYSDTRIVIPDPDLAREEVSGSFQSGDPVGFARAIAEALGVQVAVESAQVRLYR
jgi:transmembrane sensor